MNRDLRIVAEKNKPYYTLTLPDGTELNIPQPTVGMHFQILEVKKMEMSTETLADAFAAGMDVVLEYLNKNIEKKKFKKEDILKNFTVPQIQRIFGDMWNYSLGIDTEKNS